MLDTTRLVDLLLVLLFEGRKALPKSGTMPVGGPSGHMAGLRRLDSAGERSHRQLIDCIRSKDTDALIDAIDNGSELEVYFSTHWLHEVSFCLLLVRTRYAISLVGWLVAMAVKKLSQCACKFQAVLAQLFHMFYVVQPLVPQRAFRADFFRILYGILLQGKKEAANVKLG